MFSVTLCHLWKIHPCELRSTYWTFDLRGWKSWREQIQNLLDDSTGHSSTKYKDYNPFKFSVGAVSSKKVLSNPCPLFTGISDHNEKLYQRIYLILGELLVRWVLSITEYELENEF